MQRLRCRVEVDVFGNKNYYYDSKLHRKNGPAMELTNGDKYWYQNNLLHREDGPAVEYANGNKEWWVNGEYKKTEYGNNSPYDFVSNQYISAYRSYPGYYTTSAIATDGIYISTSTSTVPYTYVYTPGVGWIYNTTNNTYKTSGNYDLFIKSNK